MTPPTETEAETMRREARLEALTREGVLDDNQSARVAFRQGWREASSAAIAKATQEQTESREQMLHYIRMNDANGFATLTGDESDEDLREAVRLLREGD